MGIFLTATDQGRQRLRDSVVLLHCLIVCSIIGGFVSLSLVPSLYPGRPKLRLFSLAIGSFSGLFGLVAACQLGSTNQLLAKLDRVQEEIEISRMAAEQYVQSERATAEAEAALAQSATYPTYSTYPTYQPPQIPASEREVVREVPQEVREEVPQESREEVAPSGKAEQIKFALSLIASARKAQEEGMAESRIIQDVLGFRGSQYNKGKSLLAEIKGGATDAGN